MGEVNDAESLDASRFSDCVRASVDASAILIKHAVPHFKAARQGSIVLYSSIAGVRGAALMPAYTAAKHGVVGLMRAYTRELSPWGIRVNALLPGPIESAMALNLQYELQKRAGRSAQVNNKMPTNSAQSIPLGRLCTLDDVANVTIFLLSDAAEYMTGCAVNIDGGAQVKY